MGTLIPDCCDLIYDSPAVQLPGGLAPAEDGPGSTHYQTRVSAGGDLTRPDTWQYTIYLNLWLCH